MKKSIIFLSRLWAGLNRIFSWVRKWEQGFIYSYDLFSRIIKTILFLFVLVMVVLSWRSIDKARTIFGIYGIAEQYTPVRTEPLPSEQPQNVVEQNGKTVLEIRGDFKVTDASCYFEKILIVGDPDYKQEFVYNNEKFKITNIREYIGLLLDGGKAEGPIIRGVTCVLDN